MTTLWVICVDDQREVLNNVVRDLSPLTAWLDIDECESANEALELIDEMDSKGTSPALIISDHLMPGKSGVELLTQLQTDGRFPHLKKILLTGQATHKDTIQAINQAHIDFYFEKPWQPEKLQAMVRKLLTDYLFESGLYDKSYRTFADGESLLNHLKGDE